MKKVLAVFLAVLMAFSFVSVTAFAKVENSDKIVGELLNDDEYSHVEYVVNKNYFKTQLGFYSAFSLYDGALDNLFTGSVDVANAKAILLGLIEEIEAEFNNETFEQIMGVLSAAKKGADVVEKIDEYTGILGLAENAAWAKSLTAVNAVLKAATISNELYEQYVQAYAVILSCQAANVYFGDLLDYIAANVDDKNVKKAATELKENITKDLDEATNELIAKLAETAGKEGASIAVDVAMASNPVTTVISTVYNAVGSVGNMLFKTKEKAKYMSSLAILVRIEAVLPAYVNSVLAGEDELAEDFAVSSLLTMRKTGESMLANLGAVTEDGIGEKIINAVDLRETTQNAAKAATKLDVYSKLMKLDDSVKVVEVYTSIGNSKKATYKDSEGIILATIAAGKDLDTYDENGYYLNAYNEAAASYVQVIVAFVEGTSVNYATVSNGGGSSSTTQKTGFAAIFQSIIDAIINAFKSIFSFGKK